MQRIEIAYGRWVVQHRWWVLTISVIAVILSASGMKYLTLNNDTRVFFGKDNPQLQAFEALENTYSRIDGVLIVVAPNDGNVFTRKTLASIEELTTEAWQIPYSSRVNSITNFQHTRARGDDLVVEDLVRDAMTLTDEALDSIRAVGLTDPQLVNSVVSDRGHVAGISIKVQLPGASLTEVGEVAAFTRKMAADFSARHPDIQLHLAGSVMSDNAFGEAGMKDMSTLIPLMFMVLVVVVGIALRSYVGTLTTLLIVVIATATGMGLAGWLRIPLTAASTNAPTIILTLAVADCVHILATFFQQMRRGQSRNQAVAEAVRVNLQPIFLTSATTAIGFLAMNFSDAPPFRDLGNIVAMGVMSAFFYSVLLLPALLTVLPMRVRTSSSSGVNRSWDRMADFMIARRNLVFWGIVAVVLILGAGVLRIDLQDNWATYFDESFAFRRATDYAEQNLTGINAIEYSLASGEPQGISDPEYLTTVEAFADWYRSQPGVVHVSTVTDIMKRLNRSMHGDDEAYYRLPEQRELAAQYLLLYEMSLPFGFDLNDQIDVERSSTRLIATIRNPTTNQIREMDTRAREWLHANAPAHMFTYGSGMSVIWAHISQRNINSMLGASFAALVLISVLIILALRSVKLGLLSLVPNLAPAFVAFGLWGLIVGKVGLGLSVMAAMTLGIVVDDTVHFLSKYQRARREHDLDPNGAIRYSYRAVGSAMGITSSALVAGFMVLTFSGFKMNSDMGLLSAITITLALGLDLLLLPALLLKTEVARDEEITVDPGAELVPVGVRSSGRNTER